MKKLLTLLFTILITSNLYSQVNEIKKEWYSNEVRQSWYQFLYMAFTISTFVHGGITDARLYDPNTDDYPAFLKHDAYYLGGFMVNITGIVYFAHKWKPKSKGKFIKVTASNILLGSLAWDYGFGKFRYNDPLYPYDDWYGGHGFSSKKQRIAFDAIRFTAAMILRIW